MTPYRRTGSRCWWLTVTTRNKSYVRLTSGTHDRAVADDMELMLRSLSRRGSRDWDLIDALLERRVSVPKLYDHWRAGDLDVLRAELDDVDLAPEIKAWEERVSRELKPETVRKYVAQVARIFPRSEKGEWEEVMRSTVSRAWLRKQLAAVPGSNTNRLRHHAAWRSLFGDLTKADLFETNPMDGVTPPPPDESRTPHIEQLGDVIRLVNAMPEGMHRALAALREGSGMEHDAWARFRRSDVVDEEHRIVWAHGEKNKYRDRQVEVDEWAWKIVWPWIKAQALLPDALVFGVTHRQHLDAHTEACEALREKGVRIPEKYTPHACRHTFAIRHLKEGREEWWVANNLGHGDTTEVRRLYGKFRPKPMDLIRAQKRRREKSS